MNTKKMILLLVLSGALSACGSSGDAGSSSSASLFKSWISTVDGTEVDLSGMEFYTNYPIRYYVATNTGCDCTIHIEGNNSSGAAYLSSCDHFGPIDYCSEGTTQWDYINSNGTLRICEGSSCEDFR